MTELHSNRKNWPAGDPIPRKSRRHDAGVIFKSCRCQHIESPERLPDYRKIGGAISFDRISDDLFEKVLGTTDIIQKLVRGLPANFQMPMTVTCHLMTIGMNFFDNLREAFG
jgi:hypothetical protein